MSQNAMKGQERLQKGIISVYTEHQAGTSCEVLQKCGTEASVAYKHRVIQSKDRTVTVLLQHFGYIAVSQRGRRLMQ